MNLVAAVTVPAPTMPYIQSMVLLQSLTALPSQQIPDTLVVIFKPSMPAAVYVEPPLVLTVPEPLHCRHCPHVP